MEADLSIRGAMPRPILLCVLLAAPAFGQQPDFEVRVLEDAAHQPLPSAEARLQMAGKRELSADLDTDREGVARASGLAPGEYTLTVSKANYVAAKLTIRVPRAPLTVHLVHYGILSGSVTDSRGRPAPGRVQASYGRTIGGARVNILARSETGAIAVFRELDLGDDGRYRIYDLPPGEYAVGLWYDGLPDGAGMTLYPDTAHPRWFTIGGGEEHNGIDFQIAQRPSVQVRGRVALPKPKTTFALALGLPDQPLLPIAQALTADDGSFVFPHVAPGTYDLFIAGPDVGYGSHDSLIDRNPLYTRTRINVGATDVGGIELAPAPGKAVVVTLGSGKPPAGCPSSAEVTVRIVEPWGISRSAATQTVGFGKETTIGGLPPGRIELTASNISGACYAANAPEVDLAGEAPGKVTLELAAAGAIQGTLRAADPSAYTVVLLPPGADVEARLAVPDAAGRFSYEGLKPGKYRIAARPAGPARWISDPTKMIEVQIPGGSPINLELHPQQGDRQ